MLKNRATALRNRTTELRKNIAFQDRITELRKNVKLDERVTSFRENAKIEERATAFRKNIKLDERAAALRKGVSNPHHYPAAALAIAAVAVGVAPLTASAATTSSASKPATTATSTATGSTAASGTSNSTAATQTAAPQASSTQSSSSSSNSSSGNSSSSNSSSSSSSQQSAKAATPSNPWSGTSWSQLLPNGTDGSQSSVTLDSDQWVNATTIVNAAENLHLTPYAATIAVATSLQESKLVNLNVAVDHDSLGLFQQRPSTGWGTPSEILNPTYAADAFLNNLPSNYQSEQVDVAAQSVQRSFDGQLYAQWEDQAAHIVYTIVNS